MERVRIVDLFEALMEVLTPDGVQASTWDLFHGAIFGRDSLRVALDLLPWHRNLGERVIFSLARLQGKKDNATTEEEPGRIHHEYRHMFVGGRKIGHRQIEILQNVSRLWGGTEKEVIYYGTIDATPQYIRLVAAHVRMQGTGILAEEFIHRNGTVQTIGHSVLEAVRWVAMRIGRSELGLLEFQRTNPHGLLWQAMRDGALSYLHEDGILANAKAPIASLEVQGLAYDALTYAAELFQEELPLEAAAWVQLAQNLQRTVFERFWMPEANCFAMAIDRDEHGAPRLVRTITSVQAELLETRIFDSLAEADKELYMGAIIRSMYSPEFITDVGIRSRALKYHELLPLWDYQGSLVSWVVMSNVFALGLRRQGFLDLAEDMENRMINGASIAKELLEYFYVGSDGRVSYRYEDVPHIEAAPGEADIIVGTNAPEHTQAWTVSALLAILLRRESPKEVFVAQAPAYWQRTIEQEIQMGIPKTRLIDDEEITRTAGNYSQFRINTQEGKKVERSILEGSGYVE